MNVLSLFVLMAIFPAFATIHTDTEKINVQHNKPSSRVMWHMPRHQPKVALTFDDGPDDTITPALLSVLQQKKVKATFFLVGHMVAKFPHVVQRIVNDGHEIANHTWAHYRLDEMTQHQVSLQLSATTAAFQQMGIPMKPYIRPPGGRFNNYVIHAAKDQDLTMVMWDVNAADYKDANGSLPSVAAIQNRVLRQVRPGSIVLMHNSTATVQALPGIIDALIQKNYQLGVLKW